MRFNDLIKRPAKPQRPLTYTESLQAKLRQELSVKPSPKFTALEWAIMEGGGSLELPKDQWVADISNSAKQEVGGDLIGLVQTAYSNTPQGSFVNSIKDVVPSDWNVIDFDADPDIDSCVFYRGPRSNESWIGHKIQGLGHDGSRASKDKAINKINELLRLPGWWIESSDAMRAVLKKYNAPVVTNVEVLKTLFNDPNLTMIDSDTYTRKLPNGGKVSETVFGNPKVK
jgi:hypothetical protein